MNTATKRIVDHATLRAFAASLLEAGGFVPDHAAQTADLLVWANLRGADSHGVLRIPRYLEMVELGIINTKAELRFVSEFGATAVLDADRAPGAVGMTMAAEKAVALASSSGIGWCSVRNVSHAGAVGYYAHQIARAGMVGILMTASKPLMIYSGSKARGGKFRPIRSPSPRRRGIPSAQFYWTCRRLQLPLGKIMAARDAGSGDPAWVGR